MNTSIITLPPEYGSAALSGKRETKGRKKDSLLKGNIFFLTRREFALRLCGRGKPVPNRAIERGKEGVE